MNTGLAHVRKVFASIMTVSSIVSMTLASCSNDNNDGKTTIIEKESFFPNGLPAIEAHSKRIFCFCSDSMGFAVSPLPPKEADHEQRFVVSRSADRGRTWKKECTGKGSCLEVAEYGDKLFLVTQRRKKGVQEDSIYIWKTAQAKFRPKAILKTTEEIYGFHAFDENTYFASSIGKKTGFHIC